MSDLNSSGLIGESERTSRELWSNLSVKYVVPPEEVGLFELG